ncbi:MAG TPA: PhzF family phenazine biosynthesis protein [Azospirillaceae bacterium]|nr:PhzF family phenazine biosynthesis protein [Azospirillaceae bacterium]
MPIRLSYMTVDVFTDRPFGGNPLAVFTDPQGLDDTTMRRLANELNLSETVFLLPPETPEGTRKVRIFTPASELPFAGHPTVGAAVVLAQSGALPELNDHGLADIVFEEGVGPVRVRVERRDGGLTAATLTAARLPERVGTGVDHETLAALLGLPVDALETRVAAGGYSAGVPFLFIPVRDAQALGRIRFDAGVWRDTFAKLAAPHIYAVTMADWRNGRTIASRMFAPAMGIVEDPATGGAAAALAGFLSDHQTLADGTAAWTVHQGEHMGRPSTIELAVDIAAGRATAVRVGGTAVAMSEGTFVLHR